MDWLIEISLKIPTLTYLSYLLTRYQIDLNVSLDFVSGNFEILGKQNSLFPKGPVIKSFVM